MKAQTKCWVLSLTISFLSLSTVHNQVGTPIHAIRLLMTNDFVRTIALQSTKGITSSSIATPALVVMVSQLFVPPHPFSYWKLDLRYRALLILMSLFLASSLRTTLSLKGANSVPPLRSWFVRLNQMQ